MFVSMYMVLFNAAVQAQTAIDEARYTDAKQILQEGIDAAENMVIDFGAAAEEEHRLYPYIFYDA